ncbi:MAG: hypothetical protein Q3993_07905 [Filifactor alocis]|nr:hypothetical protein [Filifactor alocis]
MKSTSLRFFAVFLIGICAGFFISKALEGGSPYYRSSNDIPEIDVVSVSYPVEYETLIFGNKSAEEIEKFCGELTDEILLLKDKEKYKEGDVQALLADIVESGSNAFLVGWKEAASDKEWENMKQHLSIAFSQEGVQYSSSGDQELTLDFENIPDSVKKEMESRGIKIYHSHHQ